MIAEQVAKKIVSLIGEVSNKTANEVAALACMNLTHKPSNPAGGYQWFGYSWLPYVTEVNMLEEPTGLRRIEFIVARADELDLSEIAKWKSAMESELGKPVFQGSFRQSGFPDDEDGHEATAWNVDHVRCVLLNRKDDAETPQELVLVLKH